MARLLAANDVCQCPRRLSEKSAHSHQNELKCLAGNKLLPLICTSCLSAPKVPLSLLLGGEWQEFCSNVPQLHRHRAAAPTPPHCDCHLTAARQEIMGGAGIWPVFGWMQSRHLNTGHWCQHLSSDRGVGARVTTQLRVTSDVRMPWLCPGSHSLSIHATFMVLFIYTNLLLWQQWEGIRWHLPLLKYAGGNCTPFASWMITLTIVLREGDEHSPLWVLQVLAQGLFALCQGAY